MIALMHSCHVDDRVPNYKCAAIFNNMSVSALSCVPSLRAEGKCKNLYSSAAISALAYFIVATLALRLAL